MYAEGWNSILGCLTRLSKFAKYSNLVRCKRKWLGPLVNADGLTTTLKDRVLTIQLE